METLLEFDLRQIADRAGGTVVGDDRLVVTGIASLADASPGQISFFADQRFKDLLRTTKASAILIAEPNPVFKGSQIIVRNPALAYAKVAALFVLPSRVVGISERAFISRSAVIGANVSIYPFAYLGEEVIIGDQVILFPGVFVGDRAKIGNNTVLYPNVIIMNDCVIGSQVIIHAGTVIGSDGFGFVRDGSVHVKIPQMGTVQIDDHVEIGANSCIDRAALGKTWIKRGVKTDNLVQIAHNVVIGEDTLLVAQAAIGGSVRVGNQVVIGGQAAIRDHLRVEDGVMIGSQSGVAKSLGSGEIVSGSPAIPHRLWLKTTALIPHLPDFAARLRRLEKRMDDLEKRGTL
jgi:UDP-3-O-[3-hydroxymyristoyl] glucosamine N-acyltransferase